mmetsp:Transcript_24545/g.36656  ORF Transcript_24545/g.36656 Transcript_24545/m.36656 type:complete len:262 (+) Transcript_24545:216-1001(+)
MFLLFLLLLLPAVDRVDLARGLVFGFVFVFDSFFTADILISFPSLAFPLSISLSGPLSSSLSFSLSLVFKISRSFTTFVFLVDLVETDFEFAFVFVFETDVNVELDFGFGFDLDFAAAAAATAALLLLPPPFLTFEDDDANALPPLAPLPPLPFDATTEEPLEPLAALELLAALAAVLVAALAALAFFSLRFSDHSLAFNIAFRFRSSFSCFSLFFSSADIAVDEDEDEDAAAAGCCSPSLSSFLDCALRLRAVGIMCFVE